MRKLCLDRIGLDHRAAGTGRPGADEFGEGRLWCRCREDPAETGEVFTDRSREDAALGGRPVKGCGAARQTDHIPFTFREVARDDLRVDAQPRQSPHRRRKRSRSGCRADVAIGHQVDRAGRPRAISRRSPLEGSRHLADSVAAARCHAQHHREQIPVASRLQEATIAAPAIPAAKALGRDGHPFAVERAVVVVALGVEPGWSPALNSAEEHRHSGE